MLASLAHSGYGGHHGFVRKNSKTTHAAKMATVPDLRRQIHRDHAHGQPSLCSRLSGVLAPDTKWPRWLLAAMPRYLPREVLKLLVSESYP